MKNFVLSISTFLFFCAVTFATLFVFWRPNEPTFDFLTENQGGYAFVQAGPVREAPVASQTPEVTAPAQAEEAAPAGEAVRILASGGVGDVSLRPAFSPYIVLSQPTYEKMMASWHPGGIAPKVDWATEFVIVGTTTSSRILTTWNVKGGDLAVKYETADDAEDGFRYEMVVVKRAKVKSVSGVPIRWGEEKGEEKKGE